MVQDHVQHQAIGRWVVVGCRASASCSVTLCKPSSAQRRRVPVRAWRRCYPAPAPAENAAPAPAGSHHRRGRLHRAGVTGKAQESSRASTLSRYCGRPAIRSCCAWKPRGAAVKKALAGGGALVVHSGDTLLYLGRQLQLVDFIQQGTVQAAAQLLGLSQGAAVENRIAFAAAWPPARLVPAL